MESGPFPRVFPTQRSGVRIQPPFRFEELGIRTPYLFATGTGVRRPTDIVALSNRCAIGPNVVIQCIFLISRYRRIKTENFMESVVNDEEIQMRAQLLPQRVLNLHSMGICHILDLFVECRRVMFQIVCDVVFDFLDHDFFHPRMLRQAIKRPG